MCVAVRAHPMPESVCQPIVGHAVGRRSTLWILLFGRAALEVQKVVHATQTTNYLHTPPILYHQPSSPLSALHALLFLGPRIWAVACG